MTNPSWEDVLPCPPSGGQLQEMWMTSFEQPDAALFVEHLFPSLLGASHSLSQDPKERNLFFGELGTSLERLHGRLSVISSPPRGARKDSHYPWLWRYVSCFNVGAKGHAVQHAKLWAFHWKTVHQDWVELRISSTNLTTSAFKNQLQAGWRIMLPLEHRSSEKRRRSWGEMISFLDGLGASAGDAAASRLDRLVKLLGRVECPKDVSFIASIPGAKSSAKQLAKYNPSEIQILAPTIGKWDQKTLADWTADVGVSANKVHLKWISSTHCWSKSLGWVLTHDTNKNLSREGVQLDRLPENTQFIHQPRDNDKRWSHAKLYLIRSRRKRWLLVTSANWSLSAWGARQYAPKNFELGVIFETSWIDLEGVKEKFDPPRICPFCVDDAVEEEREGALGWAEARWGGEFIELTVRSTDSKTPINCTVTFSGHEEEKNVSLLESEARIDWCDAERLPITARFVQGQEVLEVDVIDLRPPRDFSKTPLPEIDSDLEADLREAFLLQLYGGPAVDSDRIPSLGDENNKAAGSGPLASYMVQAWVDTRRAFSVVDNWRGALKDAVTEPPTYAYDRICQDGDELRNLFARRDDVGSALVAEEFDWRLAEVR